MLPHRTHTKSRDEEGPEQVESGGQAVPTAELSRPSPMNQVGKCPVRGRALVRSIQGKMNTFQAATVSTLTWGPFRLENLQSSAATSSRAILDHGPGLATCLSVRRPYKAATPDSSTSLMLENGGKYCLLAII